ncbi:ribosomal-processing cysteine protease Prp [Lacticaseibacillus jixianensis]|uniref:Ribosomal processing cysteine protease Prp n=1 Tax=Lacticaseibacillus jixianensis TaxID=2486012 RepID=A0ABW4BA23_9LACO|nr:ribosomal-processing cysteine protease Prp [Lacticaseibacillus jixianensis]
MIKARFQRDEHGDISHFNLSGHADSGEYGHDIVCAAVSAVAIGAVNGIEALAGFEPSVKADEVNGGHLELTLDQPVDAEQAHIAQILLENLLLSLQSIEESYGDYLTISTQTA